METSLTEDGTGGANSLFLSEEVWSTMWDSKQAYKQGGAPTKVERIDIC